MHYIFFAALTLLVAVGQIISARTPLVETFLLYFLVIDTGLASLFSFIGHAFRSEKVAKYIGWSTGSPFQWEVAVSNLSYGVLGVLCFWLRGDFWLATIIAVSVFLLGAAYGHIRDIIVNRNFAPGNAGPALYSDILKPAVLIALYVAYRMGI